MTFPFIAIVGVVLYLYFIWRNLKDNYQSDKLIAYSWISLLTFIVAGRIVYWLINWGQWESFMDLFFVFKKPGINLAGGYVGLLAMTIGFAQKNEWKVLSILEDMTNNIMVLIFGMWLGQINFLKAGVGDLVICIIFFFCILVSVWVKNNYRSFVWYKSGKKGFRFLFVNIVFFLLLSVYYVLSKQIVYFSAMILAGLINLGELFILGEVFDSLLVNIKRKRL